MNVRMIPRSAVAGYLKLVRTPLDAATRLLPGDRTGAGPSARLAVDRLDATARTVAGAVLRDPALREDARTRRAAAQERSRAMKLRGHAAATTEQADERVEQRHEQARSRRQQADARAGNRRREAAEEKQRKQERAATTEGQRLENSREVQEKVAEKIDRDAPQERLGALETKVEADAEAQAALTEQEEASRLGDAAARIKAERKQD
jgi:hypothetical protein